MKDAAANHDGCEQMPDRRRYCERAAVSEPLAASAPAPTSGQGVRVMQNTFVVLIARLLALPIAGAANLILARYLGVEKFGQYGAIYAYLGLFGWLASLGLAPILAREAAQKREQAGSLIFTGVCIAAGFSVATAALALVIAPLVHLGGKLFPLLAIGSVEVFLLVPIALPGVIFQVDLRQWYNSGFSVVRQALMFAFALAIYWAGAPLLYVVLARLAAAGVEAGLNWRTAHRFLESPRKFLSPISMRLIRGGFIITLSVIAASVYARIDQVMLHSMVGDLKLGQYAAAVRLSEMFEALPAAFVSSLFPLLCISVIDPERFREHLDIGYRYMVLAAAGISVVVCTGAPTIIRVLYGQQYSASAPLLAVLIWSEMAIFFGTMLGNGLLSAGLQKYGLLPMIAGALVNVGLNIFLIPRRGAMGATWATVISYWMCWTVAFMPFKATRDILWTGLRLLVPITVVGLAVTGAVFLLPVNDWVRMVIAGVGFALLTTTTGLARKGDLHFIHTAWRTRLGLRAT
jgi:PST family polysaccharide transporter